MALHLLRRVLAPSSLQNKVDPFGQTERLQNVKPHRPLLSPVPFPPVLHKPSFFFSFLPFHLAHCPVEAIPKMCSFVLSIIKNQNKQQQQQPNKKHRLCVGVCVFFCFVFVFNSVIEHAIQFSADNCLTLVTVYRDIRISIHGGH